MVKEVLLLKQISLLGGNSHLCANKAAMEQLCPPKSWVLCMGSLVGKSVNHRVA